MPCHPGVVDPVRLELSQTRSPAISRRHFLPLALIGGAGGACPLSNLGGFGIEYYE